jgi:PAS domain S-box-containing protein
MSIPAAREAILRTATSDEAAATTGFRLTQEAGDQRGVVVYRAVYRGHPHPAERADALRAVVFVTLRMQQSVAAAMHAAPAYLGWCLLEAGPGAAAPRRLAGPAGCGAAVAGTLRHERRMTFGGQQWLLRITAARGQVPDAGYANAWLFSSVGLLSAAMLAALLLTVTGRTRRIEAAVAERTADLQREVTERQRTESALRESERRFRNIFDQAPIGIVYAGLSGRVADANPKLREMLGYSVDDLAQHTLAELTHPDDRAGVAQDLLRLQHGGLPEVQRRCRLRHRAGQMLWVQMGWSVLRDADGQPQRLVAVVEDITERLLREEAEQGRQQAETANSAKSEFLSRMSHELRTPLNAMLGFAQLLDLDRRPQLAPHQLAWVDQVLKAGWHLLEMINDMLDLSRIDAGMMRLTLLPVHLAPLVAHCVAMVEPASVKRGIALRVRLDAGALHALGDETRLKQVLSNLLSNAVKYNERGGRVEVSSRTIAGQRLEIRVLDTGLGLSAAQMADLFQPFNRLGREASDTEGTGIGLVISRRLAEVMGGSLHAESVEGEGSTFVLTLPVAPTGPGSQDNAPAADPDRPRYNHRRVHYVEDNETNVEVMRGMLAQRPQVALAVSMLGLDGLMAIRAGQPDLILLDMHLPDIDGLELLRQLQRDPECAQIPVVVVSADATPARIEEALAAGARHYLTKPLNLAGFLAVLDDMLESLDSKFG